MAGGGWHTGRGRQCAGRFAVGTGAAGGGPGGATSGCRGTAGRTVGGGQRRGERADALRIIPDPQNNALLIYGTGQENDTIEAMLRKIDIMPLQVRIDAVIAEVQLNDNLQYGTQFFFKSGGMNGILNFASQQSVQTAVAGRAQPEFPGLLPRRHRRRRGAVRAERVAAGDDGARAVLAAADGAGQPAGPAAGGQRGAVSEPDLAEHGDQQCAGDQLDQLPADRRDAGRDAAGEQRRAGDARHLAGGERRRRPRSPRRASTHRPSSIAASARAWWCRTARRSVWPG